MFNNMSTKRNKKLKKNRSNNKEIKYKLNVSLLTKKLYFSDLNFSIFALKSAGKHILAFK